LIAPGRAIARHMPSPANTRQGIVRRTLQVFFEGPNGDAGELQDGAIDPPSHRFGSCFEAGGCCLSSNARKPGEWLQGPSLLACGGDVGRFDAAGRQSGTATA